MPKQAKQICFDTFSLFDSLFNVSNRLERLYFKRTIVTAHHIDINVYPLFYLQVNIIRVSFVLDFLETIMIINLFTFKEQLDDVVCNMFSLSKRLLDIQDSVSSFHVDFDVVSFHHFAVNMNFLMSF